MPGEFAVHPVEVKEARGSRGSSAEHPTSRRTTIRRSGAWGRGSSRRAWAADGTLEAVEDPSLRFAVGVQWHPEASKDAELFEALVEQAREYRAIGRL